MKVQFVFYIYISLILPVSFEFGICMVFLDVYIIGGVCVVPSQNSEDRPEGPLWGP